MSAPVFVQGMRRSGTTILYDLLYEDPLLTCFYEPLASARPAVGGGSGVRDLDLSRRPKHLRCLPRATAVQALLRTSQCLQHRRACLALEHALLPLQVQ